MDKFDVYVVAVPATNAAFEELMSAGVQEYSTLASDLDEEEAFALVDMIGKS